MCVDRSKSATCCTHTLVEAGSFGFHNCDAPPPFGCCMSNCADAVLQAHTFPGLKTYPPGIMAQLNLLFCTFHDKQDLWYPKHECQCSSAWTTDWHIARHCRAWEMFAFGCVCCVQKLSKAKKHKTDNIDIPMNVKLTCKAPRHMSVWQRCHFEGCTSSCMFGCLGPRMAFVWHNEWGGPHERQAHFFLGKWTKNCQIGEMTTMLVKIMFNVQHNLPCRSIKHRMQTQWSTHAAALLQESETPVGQLLLANLLLASTTC